jgi:hypothetical protein
MFFNLHPSRIRQLLTQARRLLREHPDLRFWQETEAQDIHRPYSPGDASM